MSENTFELLIENREFTDGKWTTFDGKLPEGVYILRCKDINNEWFNRKARFLRNKGWNDASAEEWIIKLRPFQLGSKVAITANLEEVLKSVPQISLEEIARRKKEEDRKKKEAEASAKASKRPRTLMRHIGRRLQETKEDKERLSHHEMKLNHIYNGDCIQVLKTMPSNYFDAVVTDPPYNIGKSYKSGIDDHKRAEDYYEWSYRWIDECVRVLKPDGQFLIALWDRFKYHIKVYIDENHKNKLRFIQEIAWKTTGVPRAPSGKLRSDMTPWLHFGPKVQKGERIVNYTWNLNDVRSWKFVKHKDAELLRRNRRYIHPLGKDPSTLMEFYKEKDPNEFKTSSGSTFYVLNWMRKFLEVISEDFPEVANQLFDMPSNIISKRNLPATHRDRLDHPCQMPVEVPMRLIELVTNVGGKVLDPFMGTGTTGHAAYLKGRNCVGIELSPDYVNMALDRLKRSYVKQRAALEHWDGRPPEWTSDPCTPQFEDPGQKSLMDFFAIGAAGIKSLGEDVVYDIARELQVGNFAKVLFGDA